MSAAVAVAMGVVAMMLVYTAVVLLTTGPDDTP